MDLCDSGLEELILLFEVKDETVFLLEIDFLEVVVTGLQGSNFLVKMFVLPYKFLDAVDVFVLLGHHLMYDLFCLMLIAIGR